MINVRQATPADLEQLYTFENGIIQTERPFDPTLKEGPIHYYSLSELMQDPGARIVVAEENGEIVGSGFGQVRQADDYYIHKNYLLLRFMYVKPAFRGKGVNKIIIDTLSSWARDQGINELRLDVYAENTIAQNAYKKAGFKSHVLEMRKQL